MAQEIYLSLQLTADKGSIHAERKKTFNVDWATSRTSGAVQSIATAAAGTALSLNASLTTAGWAWFVNLDATNYIEIGVNNAGTFYPLVKLKPGEMAIFRLTTNTPYARANTAAADLEFGVLND